MQFSKLFLTVLSLAAAQTAVAAPSGDVTKAVDLYRSYVAEFRLGHPNLTPEQEDVIDSVSNLFSDPSNLNPENEAAIRDDAIAAFGYNEGMSLIFPSHTSGDTDDDGDIQKRRIACDCADASAWCETGWECKKGHNKCKKKNGPFACGAGGFYDCDGMCFKPHGKSKKPKRSKET